jgi:hypothetical protein
MGAFGSLAALLFFRISNLCKDKVAEIPDLK